MRCPEQMRMYTPFDALQIPGSRRSFTYYTSVDPRVFITRIPSYIQHCNALAARIAPSNYSAALACPPSSACPTLSAVVWSSAPAVSSSPPCCLMLYSCSMAVNCWSSAKLRAKGTPKKRAEVVTTQVALPLKLRAVQAAEDTVLTLPEIQPRVVGGMMSRRA